jgi:hypothetical protein
METGLRDPVRILSAAPPFVELVAAGDGHLVAVFVG